MLCTGNHQKHRSSKHDAFSECCLLSDNIILIRGLCRGSRETDAAKFLNLLYGLEIFLLLCI